VVPGPALEDLVANADLVHAGSRRLGTRSARVQGRSRGCAGALTLTELALGFEARGATIRHQDHEHIAVRVADVAGDSLRAVALLDTPTGF
jgi:hypothetical protein